MQRNSYTARLLQLLQKRYGETSVYLTEDNTEVRYWIKECWLSNERYLLVTYALFDDKIFLDKDAAKRDKDLRQSIYNFCRLRDIAFNASVRIDTYNTQLELSNLMDAPNF